MSIEYETDTLTSAKHFRAASQRFYNQVMSPSRAFVAQQESPAMLQRCPSGAKRKIRQRREEQLNNSRSQSFASPSSSSLNSSSVTSSPIPEDYSSYRSNRSLVDNSDYQSILPETDFSPFGGMRLHSTFSSSMNSLDVNTHVASPVHSKPTVEVHPMPIEIRDPMTSSSYRREKPAVPAKPKGLLVDHLNRSTSMTMLPNSLTTSAYLNNLVNSDSLLSLQNAYKNPDLGSQEFKKLEAQRNESITVVHRRIESFENDRAHIENEAEDNERLGRAILDVVHQHNPHLAARLRRHLENSAELLRIETRITNQLKKLSEHLRKSVDDHNEALFEQSRLKRRMKDIEVLRSTYDRREDQLDREMANTLNEQDHGYWRQYLKTATRLVQKEKLVDDSITDSRIHLRALHNTRPSA